MGEAGSCLRWRSPDVWCRWPALVILPALRRVLEFIYLARPHPLLPSTSTPVPDFGGLDFTRQPADILMSGFRAILLICFQDYQLFG